MHGQLRKEQKLRPKSSHGIPATKKSIYRLEDTPKGHGRSRPIAIRTVSWLSHGENSHGAYDPSVEEAEESLIINHIVFAIPWDMGTSREEWT